MINKLISGISEAICAEFGTAYKIYKESVKQGLKEPCFLISCLNPTNEQFLGNRYFRTNQFAVQYFPSTDKVNEECNDVQERLFMALELIDVGGDLTRGTSRQGELNDDVLHFFVNFDFFMNKVVTQDAMDDLDITTDAREDGNYGN